MHTTQPLRVLVLDTIHESGLDVLRHETEVTVLPGLSGDVLATAIGDYHAIIVNSDTNLTTQLINRAHQLQVIGVAGARLDRIDVHTAYAHNIEIVDVHNYAANAVAEQTLRLLLGLNVPLAGHTLGIIGFGRIGSEVARRARAFDMRIVANQPLPTLELVIADDVEMLNLPNLLAQADFISLHVPGQPTTPALLTGEHLAEKGLVKPVVGASRETLRWGIVITGIGLALCIGLYPLGWVISSDFLFNFGPWMLVGLLPTFFGLSLIIVYMVIKKEDASESEVEAPAATASIDDDDTMLTGTPPPE